MKGFLKKYWRNNLAPDVNIPIIACTIVLFAGIFMLLSCATESHNVLETESVATYKTGYIGPKYQLAVGKFANRSTYMNGIFSDGTDRLGSQAKTILKTHLAQTNRFVTMDRDNMDEIAQEAKILGKNQELTGAKVIVTGEVTEFGRKVTGDAQLFGILGHGKKQVAYSKVSINIVDVHTSQIVYAIQGAGEYALSNREILGFGGTAGYDSTLTSKVLNLAIMDAVNKLVAGLERGEWSPVK
ncbi:MAG: CsgG/HfaB family protein [Proteobacteria bacterium]|nr:CsgG/HfaB family protein [Pseudomonadota bacterium]